MRVTAPSDQKRTAVTWCASATSAATTPLTANSSSAAPRRQAGGHTIPRCFRGRCSMGVLPGCDVQLTLWIDIRKNVPRRLFSRLQLLGILSFVLGLSLLGLSVLAGRALGLAVFLADFGDVIYGFRIRRNVAVLRHRLFARIVRRNRQPVVLKRVLQKPEIADARIDILLRIKTVRHAEALRGGRHQLHQPLRALG